MPNASPRKIARLWVIPKPLAVAVAVSNARLATNGRALKRMRKSAKNTVSPMSVAVLDKWEKAKAALIYINNAIAKALINMPAPAPDIPVVPAPHATANTPNAPVPADMNGKMVAVKFKMASMVICTTATAR